MEILQLKYFRKAAEKENISAAAKVFMVPPSSVSAAIKKLEKELGTTLFDRTANSLRLNESGKIFLGAVEEAGRALQRGKAELERGIDAPRGEIRLLILTNRSRVTERISEFKKKYPAVFFTIQHTNYMEKYTDYDVIITDRQLEKNRFEARRFVHEEIFLAVHRENPLSACRGISLEQAAAEKFICMPRGSSLREYMDACFQGAGFSPAHVIACDDPYYICEYLKMGLGVTFFPGISWQKRMDARIVLLRIGEGLYRDSFIYINKFASFAAREFAKELEKSNQ